MMPVAEAWKHWKQQAAPRPRRNLDLETLRGERPATPEAAIEVLDRSCARHPRWLAIGETAPPCPICERRARTSSQLSAATLTLWATVALLVLVIALMLLTETRR